MKTASKKTFKVGDRVKTIKATRHGMIRAGEVGTVIEVRDDGTMLAGVSVEFLKAPHPIVARALGMDPNKKEPFACLFPFTSVNRQIDHA